MHKLRKRVISPNQNETVRGRSHINIEILHRTIPANASDATIRKEIGNFSSLTSSTHHQQVHHQTMKRGGIVSCGPLLEECRVGGQHWTDIAEALNNIVIDHMDSLAQVFLDDQISNIMTRCHGRPHPKQMWSDEHKILACGPSK